MVGDGNYRTSNESFKMILKFLNSIKNFFLFNCRFVCTLTPDDEFQKKYYWKKNENLFRKLWIGKYWDKVLMPEK